MYNSSRSSGASVERTKCNKAHIERILLVCGNQNAGKSRLIRQMHSDRRLGAKAAVKGPIALHSLSRERCLATLSSSPHEKGETPSEFHRRLDEIAVRARRDHWRINFVCAVQPQQSNNMPGIVKTCKGLLGYFSPERIRVVQLAPDKDGNLHSQLTPAEVDGLRDLDVEVISIDARSRQGVPAEPGNIRLLADFFDFS